ncbi:hypothetical protein IMG5_196170 [Ichthyophthirius multifiliis]|uniref:USP domain-containing protein n=1 Tax=Ichthyophthirius multifiliis TaxID=5932 RepID=G0R532_ICHMU|nr:hypothetical protein IMG5_196170 [Ichthyophthirius multifiliis]EGR27434.1 hypothetical protein IMG5_196170 [Ichthyophthirius multifiliis]|eukprot:XP_004024344.1 hypothetical protein IMG5_196170 [Ichthyophthirius multifiliis]
MTLEGWNCFKGVFCIINEQIKNMKKYNTQKSWQQQQTYNNMQSTYNQQQEDRRTNIDFDYIMLINPSNLIGMNELWKLIMINENNEVVNKALEFLNNLHSNFDQVIEQEEIEIKKCYYQQAYGQLEQILTQKEIDSQKACRCIILIKSILDESEKKGNGGLKSLISLSKGELISLHFNLCFSQYDVPNNFTIKIYSNDSVIDLLQKVGLNIKCTWEEVSLYIIDSQREISVKENGRSLAEIKLKNGQKINVFKKKAPLVKEEPILLENGEVNPVAINIFKKWFWMFAKDGKMFSEEIAKFINSCTHDNCQANDSRVVSTLNAYDKEQKGYLSEENFILFYYQACKTKPLVVRKNLESYHYRRDLKLYDEVEIENVNIEQMPRYLLSRDENFFQMIFCLLDKESLAEDAWMLLSRLPISPILYNQILDCKGADWEIILGNKSVYKQLYNLHLMEYLMEDQIDNNKEENKQKNEDDQEFLKKKNWRADFIKLGGFEFLFKMFSNLQNQIQIQSPSYQKYIFAFILKMFLKYLVVAFTILQQGNKNIYKNVARMQSTHVSLPALILSIRQDSRGLQLKRKESEFRDNFLENEVKKFELMDEVCIKLNEKLYEINVEPSEDFNALVKSIEEQNLSEIILSKFNFEQLVCELCKLCIKYTSDSNELESEDRLIIEYSLQLMGTLLLSNNSVCDYFFKNEISLFNQLIISCIFYNQNQNVRKNFNNCFFIVAKMRKFPVKIILEILIQQIPNIRNYTQYCTQYFELFCALLDCLEDSQSFDWQKLLETLTQNIKEHKSTETRIKTKNDKILIGLINLCDRILSVNEHIKINSGEILIQEIFHKCLFDISDHNSILVDQNIQEYDQKVVKCKGDQSRQAAFNLLKSLCKNCPQNLHFLMSTGLIKLLENLPVVQYRQKEPRSDLGYVGLYNLGCICYMNAMIQQFFMTPTFRNAILMADDNKELNFEEVEYNKKQMVTDDNVLHQFQQMFAYLLMSDRVEYNPIEFCFSFKDYMGEPVNTIVQQDAQEFLNMIFDKLENSLKNTPFKKILEGVYGGKTCTQLICQNCKHLSNVFETFYSLSVEVKNQKTLNESLNKFIAGETISDYKCEKCEKKVDVVKKIFLKDLPNVLIVHLQRIIFDIETVQNIKVNSRLEFPEQLDLKSYTNDVHECKNNEYFEYQLAGVVVHTGTAEYGHYYSFIDTNREDQTNQTYGETWLEFNDSKIREFQKKNIESECFGGQSNDQDDNSNFNWFKNRDNSKNAYILVYEKKIKNKIELILSNEQELKDTVNKFNLKNYEQDSNNPLIIKINYYEFKQQQAYNNTSLYKKVWIDNHQFMLERHIYNESFYSFINDIINSINLPELDQSQCPKGYYQKFNEISQQTKEQYQTLINIHAKIIFELLAKSIESNLMCENITKRLKILLQLSPEYCSEFFFKHFYTKNRNIDSYILKCSESQTRQFYSELYSLCTQIIINFHNISLQITEQNQMEFKTNNQSSQQSLIQKELFGFLMNQLSYLNDVAVRNCFKIDQYFSFWYNFTSQNSSNNTQICLSIQFKLTQFFINFFLGENSPIKYLQNISQMGNKVAQPNYNNLLKTVLNVLEHLQMIYEFDDQEKYQMPSDLKIMLNNNYFWEKILTVENLDSDILPSFVHKLAYKNLVSSEIIACAILQGLFRISSEEAKSYVSAIEHFLIIDDEFQNQRIEWILGFPGLNKSFSKNDTFGEIKDERKIQINNYGTYGMNNICDCLYKFESNLCLEQSRSVLDCIYYNKKMQENVSIQFVLLVLKLGNQIPSLLQYLAFLPSPSYAYAKYVDLFTPFIQDYYQDSNRIKYFYFPKSEYAQECLKELKSFNQKLKNIYDQNGFEQMPIYDQEYDFRNFKGFQGFSKLYTIGKTRSISIIKQGQFDISQLLEKTQNYYQQNSNNQFKNNNVLKVYERELNCYITDNIPCLTENKAYDNEIIKDNIILSNYIQSDSPWNAFFKQRQQIVYPYMSQQQLKENNTELSIFIFYFFITKIIFFFRQINGLIIQKRQMHSRIINSKQQQLQCLISYFFQDYQAKYKQFNTTQKFNLILNKTKNKLSCFCFCKN